MVYIAEVIHIQVSKPTDRVSDRVFIKALLVPIGRSHGFLQCHGCREAHKLMISAWNSLHHMYPGSPYDDIIRRRELYDQEFYFDRSRAHSNR